MPLTPGWFPRATVARWRRRIVLVNVAFALVLCTASATAQPAPATVAGPARTRIGAFVTSLSDISESQRRFDVTFWVWLLSPDAIGDVDPARTIELTNAASVDRQYAVTTATAAGRYSQVKFRATVRSPLNFQHFPFDHHALQIHLEDAERDARSVEFLPDALPNGRLPLAISRDLDPQDWSIGRLSLTTSRHVEPTTYGDPTQHGDSEYSRATLRIEITRRHSLRILLTLLLGTFMSIVVGFFAVLLPIQQSPPRYTLLSGALFVCITNRLLIDARLPTGSSLGLLDQMQFAAIGALVLLAGLSLVLTNLAEKRLAPARATQLSHRMAFGWIAALGVLEVVLVLVHRAAA